MANQWIQSRCDGAKLKTLTLNIFHRLALFFSYLKSRDFGGRSTPSISFISEQEFDWFLRFSIWAIFCPTAISWLLICSQNNGSMPEKLCLCVWKVDWLEDCEIDIRYSNICFQYNCHIRYVTVHFSHSMSFLIYLKWKIEQNTTTFCHETVERKPQSKLRLW